MKIEYQEGGAESRLVITSGFLWWRKHIHLIDEILLRAPQLRAEMIIEEHGYQVRGAIL
ncbi:hypothetical protein [Salmonella enterica]|uniref:hypothetical protein n=1 Tax=Salmonella enterica TaxID=28901 RepID=UPI000ACEEAF2|nr:hypothetical protein [Salmonella enterica]EHW7283737.1 hypothetical protein [Salmonella enterica subsp. enterica serovar Bispebjerg]HDP0191646.1 hypothetical protein [Salmonella enterica subsp. enterica serovar Concord]EIA9366112.1 hypothetical protein [Salmonella enterica]EID1645563.1 hypothetical protein [Salmonella enterica subsp. enterica serovar Napoli]HBB7065859.1 hypothetical protein [Salmonella enterica subsp. enterica serovar Napoli]